MTTLAAPNAPLFVHFESQYKSYKCYYDYTRPNCFGVNFQLLEK